MKLVITRQFGKNIWEVEKLLEALRLEVEAREKVTKSDEVCSTTMSNFTSQNRNHKKHFNYIYCG